VSDAHSTPLFVVHGALGSAAQMRPVIDALRFAGLHAVTLELAGHGESPATDAAFTMDAFAEQLRSAAAAHGGRRPVCFGYSMGGYAALLAEQQSPGTFAAIIPLGTMTAWTPAVAEQAATRLDSAMIREKLPAFADMLAARHAGAGGWEPLMTRTVQLLRTLGNAPPITVASASRMRCPVLMLVGSRDDSVSLDETAALAAAMPQGRAEGLDGVPHPLEKVPVALIVAAVKKVQQP
jgi:pimeloyl-ACP methyl ester carboxylesterase